MSNTEQKQKILLKRTTEVDRPSIPSGASHGELFLNIASGANAHNKISTMQIGTNNPIIWSDDVANEKKFASKTEVEALVKEVEDNELVTATAISTMNASAGFNEDGSSVLEGGMTLSEAIIDLRENGAKGNSYVWLLPKFPYGDNIALTDEELENFKKYNMVTFKSIIPTDETFTKVSEQYYDGVKTYSDDETIKFVSFWTPQRFEDEPNPYRWQLITFNVDISITDKTISYYPEAYDVGKLAYSATTSISATTSTKAIQDGDGNVITTTYSTKAELSGAVNDIIEEIIDNELVTSTAISTMNASAGFNEDGSSVLEGGISLSEAIIELQNQFQDQGNYYFYLNESGELASNTISDEEIEKLRNSKNIYVVDNMGNVFICNNIISLNDEIAVTANITIPFGTISDNTYNTTLVHIYISTSENKIILKTKNYRETSSYVLNATVDPETGVIAGTYISPSEINKIRKVDVVIVKIELPEGGYTFSCSKNDVNDGLIALVGSQAYGLDGFWTNTSKIVSLIITIDATTNTYNGQVRYIATGEHSKLADSATTADKAYKDGSGNVISSTYASKDELDGYVKSYAGDDMGDFYTRLTTSYVDETPLFEVNVVDSDGKESELIIDGNGLSFSNVQLHGDHESSLSINGSGLSFNCSDIMEGVVSHFNVGNTYDENDNIVSTCSFNGETLATQKYVKEIASGGIKFRGIVHELPWDGTLTFNNGDDGDIDEWKEENLQDFSVGDLIIVAPKHEEEYNEQYGGNPSADPSKEYILTEYETDDAFNYHWELLGETTVVDKRITDEINRAKAAEDEIRKHKHGKIILSGDASGATIINSGTTDNILNVIVKDDSHQHTRFANMVHFDNDIHLCNQNSNIGGTIYFGDNVDDDDIKYTYITEEVDDRLDFVSRNGFAFRYYSGYEALVSIKKSSDTEEIHMAFNKTLSDDDLYASSEIAWRGGDDAGEEIEISSNQIRLDAPTIKLNGNSTFKSYGDINFNVNRLLCKNKEVAVKNDIYNVINFRGIINEYPWEDEFVNNNYNIRDVIAYTPIIEGGEGSNGSEGSEDVLEKRDYELYIKIDNNIWAPLGGAGKNEGVEGLLDLIEENEFVISNALNRITASAGFNVNGESTLPNRQSLTEAIVELQNAVGTGPNAGGGSSLSLVANTGSGKYYLLGQADTSSNAQGVYKNAKVYMNNGRLYSESDKTLKTHIDHVNGDPELIKQIPKVYYHWKDDETKETQMGTYAQDLEKVYPELVATGEDGIKAVAYDKLGVVALAGIDKLYEIVQQLQAKNEELEKRIKELENK